MFAKRLFGRAGRYIKSPLWLITCFGLIVIFTINHRYLLGTMVFYHDAIRSRLNLCENKNIVSANVSLKIDKNVDSNITKIKNYYEKQAMERRNALRQASWGSIYNGLVPEIVCPLTIRIGRVGDGGKWVCNPLQIPDKCLIYSLGINGEISFEEDLQSLTNQRCHLIAIDSVQQSQHIIGRLTQINAEFHQIKIDGPNVYANESKIPQIQAQNNLAAIQQQKLFEAQQQENRRRFQQQQNSNGRTINASFGIDGFAKPRNDDADNVTGTIAKSTVISTTTITAKTTTTMTVETKFSAVELFNKFGHTNTTIEFFKMDIEGAEQTALPAFLDQRNKINSHFCQIFIEMHKNADLVVRLFKTFAKYGYYLFSFEINAGNFNACEFSFMHKSCFDRYGIKIVYSRIFSEN